PRRVAELLPQPEGQARARAQPPRLRRDDVARACAAADRCRLGSGAANVHAQLATRRLGRRGVALQAAEVEQHAGVLADDPRVVPRRHVEGIAGAELTLAAIVHPQRHAPLEHVADVLDLARLGARDRLHVLRPAPAGLERTPADRVSVQIYELDAALAADELPYLVRALKAFAGERCHRDLLSAWGPRGAAGRSLRRLGKRGASRAFAVAGPP